MAALALALPAPVLAQPAEPAPAPLAASPPMPKDDADKVICKRETTLGSRIATRKTCLTARQWQERAEEARQQIDGRNRAQRQS